MMTEKFVWKLLPVMSCNMYVIMQISQGEGFVGETYIDPFLMLYTYHLYTQSIHH